MIKKKMVFTLFDGSQIERDLSPVERNAPLGAGANDPYYGDIAFQASMMGVIEKETATKAYTKIFLPMAIKHVEIIFTDTSKQAEA